MEDDLPQPMTERERNNAAWELFRAGDRLQALSIATDLARQGYMPAYMLLGLIYEYGGEQVDRDLRRAVDSYRQLAIAIPSDASYIYLARAHLKIGGVEDLDRARTYLTEAGKFRKSGALCLAFGAYHECRLQWSDSARYNMLALCFGRVLGMRRASDALSKAGHRHLAWLLRALQVIIGPALRLVLGRKATEDF